MTSPKFHPASPNNPSRSTFLNLTKAVPRALPGQGAAAREVVGHFPVFPAKAWLSLNWSRSCPLGCAYCYRPGRETEDQLGGAHIYDEEFVRDYLLGHPYFVPDFGTGMSEFPPSVIGLHTSSTDPLVPQSWPATKRMLLLLDEAGLKNPVIVISKWFLDRGQIRELDTTIRNLRLIFGVTYSAMPAAIEPAVLRFAERREFLAELVRTRFPVIHYYRPVTSWNSSEADITQAFTFGSRAGAIVTGGITLADVELRQLDALGIPHPEAPAEGWEAFGYRRKYLNSTVWSRILRIRDALGISTPLFRRASCALSYLQGSEDLNAYRREALSNCSPACPNCQVERCEAGGVPPTPERVRAALRRMGVPNQQFEITPTMLRVEPGELQFHLLDAFALRHLLCFPVSLMRTQSRARAPIERSKSTRPERPAALKEALR